MKVLAILLITAAALAGCGGANGGETSATTASAPPAETAAKGPAASKLPPGAVGPVDTQEEASEGPAATEASPEAPAEGPVATGDLSGADRAAVTAVVSEYVEALDRHQAARVCALLEPGALDPAELPKRHGGCRASLAASIGTRPRSGGPAWQRTALF